MKPKILALAGSTRTNSFNKKIAKLAAQAAEEAGASVTYVDLQDYPMPIYDGDLEDKEGLPDKAKALKTLFTESQGLILASPEYNSAPSAVLKNTIDWVSRQESESEKPLIAFTNKTAALFAASPGNLGGLRGLVHLRMILSNIDVTVLPTQFTLPQAHKHFDEAGILTHEPSQKKINNLAQSLTNHLLQLKK